MMKFFEKPAEFAIGCDPGPEHSAFAVLDCRSGVKTYAVGYVRNSDLDFFHSGTNLLERILMDFGRTRDEVALINGSYELTPAFAFERCAVQSGGANQLVFETCMTAGEIRHLMLDVSGANCHSFSPSDWRYILTGKGCANDANVRNLLLTLLPECDTICRSYSRKAKEMYGLRKPITSHLRDAVGVAMAMGFVGYRRGLTLGQFPARLEVTCG